MIQVSLPIQTIAILASLSYLVSIIAAMRNSHMSVKQSLIWLFSALLFFVLSIFPYPLLLLAKSLGFVAPSNAVFVAWLMVTTTLIFYQSLTTSKQANQIRTLAQELAILKAERQQHRQKDK